MSNTMPQVQLVHFYTEYIPTDFPFVEYAIFRDRPQVVERNSINSCEVVSHETAKVPVTEWIEYDGRVHKTRLIALTRESQAFIDMYVEQETRRLREIIEDYKRANANLDKLRLHEKNKSCFKRLMEYLNNDLHVGRIFNG